MLLAAGLGSRLRPWTDDRPKCMVEVAGRPLIDWTIDWLVSEGVTELVINLHHRPEVLTAHLGDGRTLGLSIEYSYEEWLRGTAGAVAAASDLLGPGRFLTVYADNLVRCSLRRLLEQHVASSATMTVALHGREDVSGSGVAEIDADGYIRRFVEKPAPGTTTSRWVSAGLLVCEPAVLDYIPSDRASDFGRDVIPAIVAAHERVGGYSMHSPERLLWIDTPQDLARTERQLAQEVLS